MVELILIGLIGLLLTTICIKYLIYKCDLNVPIGGVEMPDNECDLNVPIGGVEMPDNDIPPKYEDIMIN